VRSLFSFLWFLLKFSPNFLLRIDWVISLGAFNFRWVNYFEVAGSMEVWPIMLGFDFRYFSWGL
jgi:hypothetical protein